MLFNTVNHLLEKQNENHSKIETQNYTIENQNKKLESIGKKNLELQNTIKTQNATIKNQNKKLMDLEDLIINKSNFTKNIGNNQFKDLEKQIGTLNQFAKDMSKLHLTLSNPSIHLNYPTLDQKEYEERQEIKQWNNFTEEISKRNDAPDYIEILKEAVVSYSICIFPRDYLDRYRTASSMLQSGIFHPKHFLKIYSPFDVNYVSLKVFDDMSRFDKELRTKRYLQNSHGVASFPDAKTRTLTIAVLHGSKSTTLYHSNDENKNLKIPRDGTKVDMENLDDGAGFQNCSCIIFRFHF